MNIVFWLLMLVFAYIVLVLAYAFFYNRWLRDRPVRRSCGDCGKPITEYDYLEYDKSCLSCYQKLVAKTEYPKHPDDMAKF